MCMTVGIISSTLRCEHECEGLVGPSVNVWGPEEEAFSEIQSQVRIHVKIEYWFLEQCSWIQKQWCF